MGCNRLLVIQLRIATHERWELNTLLDEPERGMKTMIKTWNEGALERGQQIVMEQWRRALLRQLATRFGPLSESVQQKLALLSTVPLEALSGALMTAQSLRELGLEDDATGTAT